MSNVTIRQLLQNPSDEDVCAAVEVLNQAFREHKPSYAMFKGHMEFLPSTNRAIVRAGALEGRVYVAELPDAGIVGTSVWFGPGKLFLSTEEQREVGFNETMSEMKAVLPEIMPWWDNFLAAYRAMSDKALKSETYKMDGWNLQRLGVHPDFQSHGVGAIIVNHLIHVVSQEALKSSRHISLETDSEKALRFYKRLGFEEKGRALFKSDEPLDIEFTLYCLALELGD